MDFEKIKDNAPDGATHYKVWKCGSVDYIVVNSDGIYDLWYSGQWIPLPYKYFSKPLKIKSLHGE